MTTILVLEYVTGGGLAGREVPASWVAEGSAMRRAIADDFAAVAGVRVVVATDPRWPVAGRPGLVARVVDREGDSLASIAAEADWTAIIAPETGGILADLTRAVNRAGGRSIGAEPGAIDLVGDKARLADHFEARGIPTPPSRVVNLDPGWTADRDGPIILKPIDGAGSLDTLVVRDGGPFPTGVMLMQPFLPGVPMSASYLVDARGRRTLLAVGRQRVEVNRAGRLTYRGGTVPAGSGLDLAEVNRAVGSVAGLRGFVGVDYLDGPDGVSILEINPRPTTSYVGLARLLPPGTIAAAWLAAASGPLEGTGWPDRLRPARSARPVTFDADGSIHPRG